jgi:hypothetical protein
VPEGIGGKEIIKSPIALDMENGVSEGKTSRPEVALARAADQGRGFEEGL